MQDIAWDRETDVLVIGGGGAGLASAIAAHDHGARTLVIEKMPNVGGITILAGGGLKAAKQLEAAIAYLTRTQGGRVHASLIEAFAQGLVELPGYLRELAKINGAVVSARYERHEGVYDFPGAETLFSLNVSDIPGFSGYDWTYTGDRFDGQRFFKVLLDNAEARNIPILTNAPARALIADADGAVIGARVEIDGREVKIRAARAVILACGGFEFNEKLKREFFEAQPVYAMGNPGNTGDGVLMAQKVGAALWHMWHYHGSYGFKFDDYEAAFRIAPSGARQNNRRTPWILVDKTGRRFMNELHPATQDTAGRPLGQFDPDRLDYTRIPAYMIFDERGRKLGRIANPLTAQRDHRYVWSEDNFAEVERGWIRKFASLDELSAAHQWDAATLKATVKQWNAHVAAGADSDHLRPGGTLFSIAEPPFYAVPVWPLLTNTQGGPEHDAKQRIVDPWGAHIPGLYAAGELGSFFAHLYLLGGNLSEIIVSGRVAGREAAALVSKF